MRITRSRMYRIIIIIDSMLDKISGLPQFFINLQNNTVNIYNLNLDWFEKSNDSDNPL